MAHQTYGAPKREPLANPPDNVGGLVSWAARFKQQVEQFIDKFTKGELEIQSHLRTSGGRIRNGRRVTSGSIVDIIHADEVVYIDVPNAMQVNLPEPLHAGWEVVIWDASGAAASNVISIVPPVSTSLNGGAGALTISTNWARRVISYDGDQYLGV